MTRDDPSSSHLRRTEASESRESEKITLDHLEAGRKAIVTGIHATVSPLRRRLMELGITTGSEIKVIRRAPFGGPIEISIRGYRLSLRRADACLVTLRRIR